MKLAPYLRKAIFATLFAVVATWAAAQSTPPELAPPSGSVESFRASAEGVQIYVSAPINGSPNAFEWHLEEPRAVLYEKKPGARTNLRHPIAIHRSGPTWESLSDCSRVVAARKTAVTVDKSAIAWLAIEPALQPEGATGQFADVTFIQRIRTLGGLPPSNPPQSAGVRRAVPYSAEYVFYKKQ